MIEGNTVASIRLQTKKEMEAEGWDQPATVLIFDNGMKLYASRDEEGNGAGALFGVTPSGEFFALA